MIKTVEVNISNLEVLAKFIAKAHDASADIAEALTWIYNHETGLIEAAPLVGSEEESAVVKEDDLEKEDQSDEDNDELNEDSSSGPEESPSACLIVPSGPGGQESKVTSSMPMSQVLKQLNLNEGDLVKDCCGKVYRVESAEYKLPTFPIEYVVLSSGGIYNLADFNALNVGGLMPFTSLVTGAFTNPATPPLPEDIPTFGGMGGGGGGTGGGFNGCAILRPLVFAAATEDSVMISGNLISIISPDPEGDPLSIVGEPFVFNVIDPVLNLNLGVLTIGTYNFVLSAEAQQLGEGYSRVFTYTFYVTDGHADCLIPVIFELLVTGLNDCPTINPIITPEAITKDEYDSNGYPVNVVGNILTDGNAMDIESDDMDILSIDGLVDASDGNVDGDITIVKNEGTLTVNIETGAYTFVPNSDYLQQFNKDDPQIVLNYAVLITDNHLDPNTGLLCAVPTQLVIKINPANDCPTIDAMVMPEAISEDAVGVSGNILLNGNAMDPESDDMDILSIDGLVDTSDGNADGDITIVKNEGTLTVNVETGAYTFAANTAYLQQFNEDDPQIVLNYAVLITDNHLDPNTGLLCAVPTQLVIKINPANDCPTIDAMVMPEAISEDAVGVSGNILLNGNAMDPESDDMDILSIDGLVDTSDGNADGDITIVKNEGTLTVNVETGAYTFAANTAYLQQFNEDDPQIVLNYAVLITDNHLDPNTGLLCAVPTQLVIKINPANDCPTIDAMVMPEAISEDAVGVSGNILLNGNAMDPESDDMDILSIDGLVDTSDGNADGDITIVKNEGTLTVNVETGAYTFAANTAYLQQFNEDDPQIVLNYAVLITDNHLDPNTGLLCAVPTQLVIKINPANDCPTIDAMVMPEAISEDAVGVSGNILLNGNAMDPESDDMDILSIDGLVDTSDGNADGDITIVKNEGTLTVNVETGAYTFAANTAYLQQFNEDDPQIVLNYAVLITDNHLDPNTGLLCAVPTQLVIKINPANDCPTIDAMVMPEAISEDAVGVSGNILLNGNAMDPESDDMDILSIDGLVDTSDGNADGDITIVKNEGTLTVNVETGAYTFAANTAYLQQFNEDDPQIVLNYAVLITDNHLDPNTGLLCAVPTQLVIKINPANDCPTIDAMVMPEAISEDAVGVSGNILLNGNAMDPESDDMDILSIDGLVDTSDGNVDGDITIVKNEGTLTVNVETGAYTFAANTAYLQQFNEDDPQIVLNYAVLITDNHLDPNTGLLCAVPTQLVIKINPANDCPTIDAMVMPEAISEDAEGVSGNIILDGNAMDPESDDMDILSIDGLVDTSDGNADGDITIVKNEGTLTVNVETGAYTFAANTAYLQQFNEDDPQIVLNYAVLITDNHLDPNTGLLCAVPTQLVIKINPANDCPTIDAMVMPEAISEDAEGVSGNIILDGNAMDPESDDMDILSIDGLVDTSDGNADGDITIVKNEGTLTVNVETGAYTFAANTAYLQQFNEDDPQIVLNYAVLITDNHLDPNTGLLCAVPTQLVIKINPENDIPVAVDDVFVASENQAGDILLGNKITGPGTDSDPEGDTLMINDVNLAGTPLTLTGAGTFTLSGISIVKLVDSDVDYVAGSVATFRISVDSNGDGVAQLAYIYVNSDGAEHLINNQDAFNAMSTGQSLSFNFTYTNTDGTLISNVANQTVTINGLYDPPMDCSVFPYSQEIQDEYLSIHGQALVIYNDQYQDNVSGVDPSPTIEQRYSDIATVERLALIIPDDYLNQNNGSNTNNYILGTDGNDRLQGNNCADFLNGKGGNDRLNGNSANDVHIGGAGEDSASGGNGSDIISGGIGDDTNLDGGAGNDLVDGGAGSDVIKGGNGDDVLSGGFKSIDNSTPSGYAFDVGNDTLNGDNGSDAFVFTLILEGGMIRAPGNDTVSDFSLGQGDVLAFDLVTVDTLTGAVTDAGNFTAADLDGLATFSNSGGDLLISFGSGSVILDGYSTTDFGSFQAIDNAGGFVPLGIVDYFSV